VIDYVFHAAGSASPYYIHNDPVGIINANVQGTQQVLELARSHHTKNIVFASTREVYGCVEGKLSISEDDMGVIDPLNPRDCYPESKRLAEALLMAYQTQYQVSFNTVRLAHSYGPGMEIENDGRVMADLISDVVHARDTQLKSSGEAERAFCYVTDAVSGILRVMLRGEPGLAYNLANEKEPISVFDLAHLLQELSGNSKSVRVEVNGDQSGYTNYARTAMNTKRLSGLGWDVKVGLRDGLLRTLNLCGRH
jgi:nucleoside-diphosphate-sugar epimerase